MEKVYDYKGLGLRCGLEIHQQLDTGKLFCRCPSFLRKDEPDFIIRRKLHAVAGETGKVDKAAEYQMGLGRNFIYQGYYDNNCLVEMDEDPPHEINFEALKIALQISLLLRCKVIQTTQIMRKTVIDGSNTSGFQRTVMIARDGYFETSEGMVRIESICLEEDSARIIDRKNDEVIYRLDRLGVPLVEITTSPDLKTPQQVKEAALHIGEVLRSLKVKRGIGTIRQDVNMSIKKGSRVEIKGVQNPDLIVKSINSEIKRQKEILDSGKSVKTEVRGAHLDGSTKFLRPMPGEARMYPETDLLMLRISRSLINEVKRTLPKLKEEVRKELKGGGLNEEMLKLLLKQRKVEDYKDLIKFYNNPNFVAKVICVYPKEISKKRRESFKEIYEKLQDSFSEILEAVSKNKIKEQDVKKVVEKVVSGVNVDKSLKIDKKDLKEVEDYIKRLIKEKPGLSSNAYMGLVMKEFKGHVDGREARDLIKRYQ